MRHLPIVNRVKSIFGLALATSLAFGLMETVNAASCLVSDVTINDVVATDCGWGTTNNDSTAGDTWQVNMDFAGGRTDWALYEREAGVGGGDNIHDGNTSAINLVSTQISDNPTESGLMTLNVFDPTLITLKDGGDTLYHWYYFEGITGTNLMGTWDASGIFGGDGGGAPPHNLNHISAYVVPLPAAIWLFGFGLLGLIGVARRRKTE